MGFPRPDYWSGLSCPPPGESSLPRGWTHASCTGRWILYHWVTREALGLQAFVSKAASIQESHKLSVHACSGETGSFPLRSELIGRPPKCSCWVWTSQRINGLLLCSKPSLPRAWKSRVKNIDPPSWAAEFPSPLLHPGCSSVPSFQVPDSLRRQATGASRAVSWPASHIWASELVVSSLHDSGWLAALDTLLQKHNPPQGPLSPRQKGTSRRDPGKL